MTFDQLNGALRQAGREIVGPVLRVQRSGGMAENQCGVEATMRLAYIANKPFRSPNIRTRNIVLTDEQASFVATMVQSGRYQNASEAVRDGIRLLQDATLRRAAEIESIRRGVLEGLGQAAAGDFASGTGTEAIERAFTKASADFAE